MAHRGKRHEPPKRRHAAAARLTSTPAAVSLAYGDSMMTRRILVSLRGVISGAAFWCHIEGWVFGKGNVNHVGPRSVFFTTLNGIPTEVECQCLVEAIGL